VQFDDVILGRRSTRGYKPDPVPKALIEEILKLAMRSPSSMNTQPWNFTVVAGEPLNRIRAGNTERSFASDRLLQGSIAIAKWALPSNCSVPWVSSEKTKKDAWIGCCAAFASLMLQFV
jgi:nitroreductase